MEDVSLSVADFGLSGLIKKYIRKSFEDKKVPKEQQEKLWQHYYTKLEKGLNIGYPTTFKHYDEALAHQLKYNIAEFSAFKETSFRKTLEDALTDESGKLMSWKDFKEVAYKVSNDYNHRWLETEYHQTIANAQSVSKWQDFQANKDVYPNLRLESVGDGRVRPEHQVLDGTTRPIDDPFWQTYLPPLDWGCRCDVVQTDEPITEIKGGLQLKMEFKNNPAISGKIFNGSAYAKGLSKSETKKAKETAKKKIETKTEGKTQKVEFKQMSNNQLEKSYEKQNINSKNEKIVKGENNGYIATANSFTINEELRTYGKVLRDENKTTVKALDTLIKNNSLTDNVLLYRNDGFGFLESHFGLGTSDVMKDTKDIIKKIKATKKTQIYDNGFYSTSAIKTKNVFRNRMVQTEIRAKKGTNAFITDNFSESEVILGRKQKFNIIDISEVEEKIKIVLETE